MLAALLVLAFSVKVSTANAHHVPWSKADPPYPKAVSTVKGIKGLYPDLYKRELRRPSLTPPKPVSWNHLRAMARTRWDRTHPAQVRERMINHLVLLANEFPAGAKTAGGSRWLVNSANYTLFTVLYPGADGVCLRTISGRETGGTYDHRVGYGFVYNQPYAVPAYGLPQANPPSKMAVMGSDWATNPAKQIVWMYNYTVNVYGSPCNAMRFHLAGGRAGATY